MRSRPTLVSCIIPQISHAVSKSHSGTVDRFLATSTVDVQDRFGPPLAIGAALSNRWTIVTSSSALIPACPQIGKCLASELLCSDLI